MFPTQRGYTFGSRRYLLVECNTLLHLRRFEKLCNNGYPLKNVVLNVQPLTMISRFKSVPLGSMTENLFYCVNSHPHCL